MERHTAARYFLGANSKRGFVSLYDGFTAGGEFLRVIKGGPGCGKSTLMKRIGAAAEAAGLPVEYILCSGDPDSLDGLRLPTLGTAYVDGTAPHVIEADYPGAGASYLNMGAFLKEQELRPLLPELAELNRRYKALYGEAYALLGAGAALLPKNMPGLWGAPERERVEKKADALAVRELPRLKKAGTLRRRFLSALSCRGRLRLDETVAAEAERVIVLDNALGLGHVFLDRFAGAALARGCDAVLCPDPLEPEKPEALLLPEAGLALLAGEDGPAFANPRRLRLDDIPDRELLSGRRALLRRRKKEGARLIDEALDALARAKALHDELEALYRPHVDFEGASRLAEEHIASLGL